jgi:hypothetical protein
MAKRASKIDRKLSAPDKPKRGRPRQQDLPGTEDRAIRPLEDAAHDYAEIRDERMRLTEQETGLKAKLLSLMKKYQKTTYDRDGIHVEIVHEEETVKVRVKKPSEGGEDAPDDADAGEQVAGAEA